MNRRFDRDGIESLLGELADELANRAAQADVFLVGGAAMARNLDCARSHRRTLNDVLR